MQEWNRILGGLLMVCLTLLVLACSSPSWRVRDSQNQVMDLQDPHFSPKERIRVLGGTTVREIEAWQIEWMQLDPTLAKVRQGELLYGVKLLLKGGVAIPDTVRGDSAAIAYLPVDGVLRGSQRGMQILIPLAELRELGSELEGRRRDSVRYQSMLPPEANPVDSVGPVVSPADSTVVRDSATSAP